MSVSQVLFGFGGRISRSEYWLKGVLVLVGVSVVSNILMASMQNAVGLTIAVLVSVASLWPSLAISVKRLHDRNRSPWLLLGVLIPLVNIPIGLWLIVETGFLRGTVGPNRYGADPLSGVAAGSALQDYGNNWDDRTETTGRDSAEVAADSQDYSSDGGDFGGGD